MAGTHTKGTNDADGDGKKGGSKPETAETAADPKAAAAAEPEAKAAEAEAEKPAKGKKANKPASTEERVEALEKEVADLRGLMRRNGWTC